MLSYLWGKTENSTNEEFTIFPSIQTKTIMATVNGLIEQLSINQLSGSGTVPTILPGLAAGTPTVLTISGTNTAGTITVTTGTTIASNTIVAVTFSTPYTTAPHVIFSPLNEISGTHISRVHATSTTDSFSLVCSSSALSSAVQYQWNYIVIQ